MIIIPDIHARSFWKDVVKDREDEEIVFLGDYLDPYFWEGFTKKDAIDNFLEIIEFKKKHMDNVILLLGNHDFGGYIYEEMPKCRFDYTNAEKCREIFRENRDLFQIGLFKVINGKKFTFSHSCILDTWIKYIENELGEIESLEELFNKLNTLYNNNEKELLIKLLSIISRHRGGLNHFGSIIWADVNEIISHKNETFSDVYQIFGHSQQEIDPIITERFACLDCRKAFEINNNGEIKEVKNG